ncbi:trypsin-like peptidase domain-containing protein [Patescibacteria group bacterium]|nr:trypsin-like peptidase domain-containing protein [Patescibacteria group bacterium]
MQKSTKILLVLVIAALVFSDAVVVGAGAYFYQKQAKSDNGQITNLASQLKNLQTQVATLAKLPPQEIIQREVVQQKSQDQMLTEAVKQVTPAVVSVVISKDVPQLQVTYENPFGNDPMFQNLGFQIPVYQQVGTQKQKVGAGTGFIIRSDGYILTNKHVVADDTAQYTVLLSDGTQKTAQVVYKDPQNDIAIIKIDGTGYPTVQLGDSSKLQLGETVAAIGNALGEYNNSVSVGVISGLNRTIQASSDNGSTETLTGIIQTDAAINPGNSGGPLLDLNGHVVGINVATVVGSNSIGFSIPINMVKNIITTVLGK